MGLAMSPEQLSSLHDIFQLLEDNFRTLETGYVLQFMWRDLSSDFDVIGPYFTSAGNMEAKFVLACLFDTMFVFEVYGFRILGLVCDGASINLSLLKRLCGVRGQYGTDATAEGGITMVPSSFVNPYSGDRTHLIICPSHQINMHIKKILFTIHQLHDVCVFLVCIIVIYSRYYICLI